MQSLHVALIILCYAGSHCTWRDVNAIGKHLVAAVAIAVQRCTGMALQASADREMRMAMGEEAA